VAMAYLTSRDVAGSRRMIREAYRRGRKAAWLPAADWESLLQQPIEEVRAKLGLEDLPVYEELRSTAGELALKSQ